MKYQTQRYTLLTGILVAAMLVSLPTFADPAPGSDAAIENSLRNTLSLELQTEIFDWVEGAVENGNILLTGQVYDPFTKRNIIRYAKKIEGVHTIYDNVEVIQPSDYDDELRKRLYQSIYYQSEFAPVGIARVHIIVNGGRVALEGIVYSEAESRRAEARARSVGGSFKIENRLRVQSETNS